MKSFKAPMSPLAQSILNSPEGRRLLEQALRDGKPFIWRGQTYHVKTARAFEGEGEE